jgi:hypothetical protein
MLEVILLFLLATNLARADLPPESEESCPTVDLSDRVSAPRDQGGAGFCYSFTASDLLSEAAGIQPPDSVSAFHSGSQYISLNQDELAAANKKIDFAYSIRAPTGNGFGGGMMMQGMGEWKGDPGQGGMGQPGISGFKPFDPQKQFHRKVDMKGKGLLRREAGYVEIIAAHIMNQGRVCLESEIPSQAMLRNSEDSEQRSYFMMKMGRMAGGDDLNKAAAEIAKAHAEKYPPLAADPARPFCFQRAPEPFRFLKPLETLNVAVQDWAAARLRRDTEAQCKHPVALPKNLAIRSREYPELGGVDLVQARDDMRGLMKRGRPVALSYDSCVITKCKPGEAGSHASVVVGRGWNKEKNQCELKIKNSWGAGCNAAKPGLKCEGGYYFAPEDEIYNAGHRIVWIDK